MHIPDPRGHTTFQLSLTCSALAILAVGTRIYCKLRQQRNGICLDDYLILVGLGLYAAASGVLAWGIVEGGGGRELQELLGMVRKDRGKVGVMRNYLLSLWISFLLSMAVTYTIKMSILVFYHRIFRVTTSYERASYLVMALVTLSFTGSFIPMLAQCSPLDKIWNRLKPGKCFDFNVYYLATGVIDAVMDCLVLLLPIRMAFTLHLPLRTKLAVAGIFALGSFVVVTNVIRVAYTYQPNAQYASYRSAERWSEIHILTAFICACLPIYKPLWTSLASATGKLLSRSLRTLRGSSGSSHPKASRGSSYIRMNTFPETMDPSATSKSGQTMLSTTTTKVTAGSGDDDGVPLRIPKDQIGYSRTIDIA